MIRYFSLSFLRRSVLLLKNFEEKEREREKRVEKEGKVRKKNVAVATRQLHSVESYASLTVYRNSI